MEENIELDWLSEEQREIAETVGIEVYRKLVRVYGGASIYISKPKVPYPIRNSEILRLFDGGNYKALARKFGLSEGRIRAIIRAEIKNLRK